MELNSSIAINNEQYLLISQLIEQNLGSEIEVWIYGSRIAGKFHSSSDLDMVLFTGEDQLMAVSELKEAFEESDLPFRVDVFVWDEIPAQFKKNIKKEHILFK